MVFEHTHKQSYIIVLLFSKRYANWVVEKEWVGIEQIYLTHFFMYQDWFDKLGRRLMKTDKLMRHNLWETGNVLSDIKGFVSNREKWRQFVDTM